MELQALLVLCGVAVAGAAVVLLMGLFSASGTSYEEAVAQQRRATTELLALAESKNKPKKKDKKASKKQAKKEKREVVVTPSSEAESEAPAESGADDDPAPPAAPVASTKPHVEFSPSVVVEVNDAPPQLKIRKRGKDPKVKPILINKEDPSCVSDTSLPTPGTDYTNHFEEMHPKDEIELILHEKAERKEEAAAEKKEAKQAKAAKNSKAKPAPPLTEPAKEEPRERNNSGEAPKEQRKAKKEKRSISEDAVDAPREEIVQPLNVPQPSELTTDKLLKQVAANPATAEKVVKQIATANTPSPTTGKGKKKKPEPNVISLMAGDSGGGVNVSELERVVREAALSRTEIQILTEALLNKHHDPLPQHSDWTEGPNDPIQKIKKQLADKEKALADEIEASQALHAKLKELRATLNAERARAAATARAAEQAASAARAELHTQQARAQRLMDDNHQLHQDKLMLQSKLGAEGEAQAQRVQMEMHIQRLSESEAALVQELNALQAEMTARVVEAGAARCEAGAARDNMIIAQQHANELAQQLQEANRACNELEQQRNCAAHGEQVSQAELRQAQERINELQSEHQRLVGRLHAAEGGRDEADRQRKQLQSEVSSLKEQLAARDTELAELKALRVPAQNGLPPTDQHKTAELAKVESAVESLRAELAAAQSNCSEQRDQLDALRHQLHTYKDKNNELRTKNWKVMEALQTAERALQTKASAMPAQGSPADAVAKAQESQYSEVATLLRAACPTAAPGVPASHEWLQTFADNLKKELEKRDQEKKLLESQAAEKEKPTPPAADDARVNELRAQNEHLQALVDKYKGIIDDTEGVLSRLQANVTTEEQRWAKQLADTQRELDEVRQRTVSQEPLAFAYSCIEKSLPTIMEEMQKKIDSLQEELETVKAGNHNHTLADAERIAEERLMMASLSTKQSTDISNGPLQMGLEEK